MLLQLENQTILLHSM